MEDAFWIFDNLNVIFNEFKTYWAEKLLGLDMSSQPTQIEASSNLL